MLSLVASFTPKGGSYLRDLEQNVCYTWVNNRIFKRNLKRGHKYNSYHFVCECLKWTFFCRNYLPPTTTSAKIQTRLSCGQDAMWKFCASDNCRIFAARTFLISSGKTGGNQFLALAWSVPKRDEKASNWLKMASAKDKRNRPQSMPPVCCGGEVGRVRIAGWEVPRPRDVSYSMAR